MATPVLLVMEVVKSITSVTDIVGDNIFVQFNPRQTDPYVIVKLESGGPITFSPGSTRLGAYEFEIQAVSRKAQEAYQMQVDIADHFLSLQNVVFTNGSFRKVTGLNYDADVDTTVKSGQESPEFVNRLNFTLWMDFE